MNKEVIKEVITDLELLISHLKELSKDDKKEKKSNKKTEGKITLGDVRGYLAKLSQHGKTSEVKNLIIKYGGNKLSDIDESDYENLLNDAKEIKIE